MTAASDAGASPPLPSNTVPSNTVPPRSGQFDLLRPLARVAALEADQMAEAGVTDAGLLAASAGGDRMALAEARNFYATLVRARSDDFRATAALRLLNRAMSETPIIDPLDWKPRWHQRFRRP